MDLLEISPNARSIYYKCNSCNKKIRASAGTPEAPVILKVKKEMDDLLQKHNNISKSHQISLTINFKTNEAPLPYEQTTRSPIPEAVRSEVWRRDSGKCVQCGSKANLHFDHIIPVSKGGASSVQNLQLLCQKCNLSKGSKI